MKLTLLVSAPSAIHATLDTRTGDAQRARGLGVRAGRVGIRQREALGVELRRAAGAGAGDHVGRQRGGSVRLCRSLRRLLGRRAQRGGLHSLTKSRAAGLAPMGNRVNTVAPGPTVTDLSAGSRLPQEQLTAQYPEQRPRTAGQVAAAVVILASDDASHIHGSRSHSNERRSWRGP